MVKGQTTLGHILYKLLFEAVHHCDCDLLEQLPLGYHKGCKALSIILVLQGFVLS